MSTKTGLTNFNPPKISVGSSINKAHYLLSAPDVATAMTRVAEIKSDLTNKAPRMIVEGYVPDVTEATAWAKSFFPNGLPSMDTIGERGLEFILHSEDKFIINNIEINRAITAMRNSLDENGGISEGIINKNITDDIFFLAMSHGISEMMREADNPLGAAESLDPSDHRWHAANIVISCDDIDVNLKHSLFGLGEENSKGTKEENTGQIERDSRINIQSGPQSNNNGKIRLSVKQAAERIGVWPDAAARAFHDLQAKGFIVVTEMARLGSSGEASEPAYEITELATAHGGPEGRKLYRAWTEGSDFPVIKAKANNPKRVRRKPDPIANIVKLPSRKS